MKNIRSLLQTGLITTLFFSSCFANNIVDDLGRLPKTRPLNSRLFNFPKEISTKEFLESDTLEMENWYGYFQLIDGFTDEVIFHINSNKSVKSIKVDFPLKNIGSIWRHEPLANIEAPKFKRRITYFHL